MGSKMMVAPVPAVIDLAPPKPKRKRKPADLAQLVLPRTGRLTPAYWILKEGFHQDVFRRRAYGVRGQNFCGDWQHARLVNALIGKGFMREAKGPRGGQVYRTTDEGAFALLIAEGIHEAKRALTKDKKP